jgi:hypothetical protein
MKQGVVWYRDSGWGTWTYKQHFSCFTWAYIGVRSVCGRKRTVAGGPQTLNNNLQFRCKGNGDCIEAEAGGAGERKTWGFVRVWREGMERRVSGVARTVSWEGAGQSKSRGVE